MGDIDTYKKYDEKRNTRNPFNRENKIHNKINCSTLFVHEKMIETYTSEFLGI